MTAPRAARWARVSSRRQAESEREGLPFQRDLQDAGIRTLNATDTGLAWTVAHSGGSVHQTPEWAAMLAAAGSAYDILVVAYTSRLARDAEQLLAARRQLHERGAAIYFVEERVLTSDEATWDAFAREAVEAESYRRRLSRTMQRTYHSRVRRRGLPAGPSPYGFTRDWQHHPEQAPVVRAIFEAYAASTMSLTALARRFGLEEEHVKSIIRNPAYVGLAQHNGDLHPGTMPAIVSQDLWDRVVARRQAGRFYIPGPEPIRPSVLRGIAYCSCGRRLRLDGYDGSGAHRLRHMRPLCTAWGTSERRRTADMEIPLREALRRLRPTRQRLRDLLNEFRAAPPPDAVERVDTRPLRRQLASDFAMGRIDQDAFLAGIAKADAADAEPARPVTRPDIDWEDLIAYFDRFHTTDPDLGEDEAWLRHWTRRLFARVIWNGADTLAYEPTQEALDHFVVKAMPPAVTSGSSVGGEGLEPPTSSV